MIGTHLSHFQITAKLGEGGMGEVYRAADTKLGREVAIKVLPEAVASDPERLARFEREAKVLASLNHPHIAGIYSFESARPEGRPGESQGVLAAAGRKAPGDSPDGPPIHFLVMELAEGEDLAQRLERGAIPVDEAVPVALQIAEALEAAHQRGIIHRDLKPANVKVTTEGQVKVLDFGLAKALDPAAVATGTSAAALSMSPTLTAQMTQAGVLLGTAAYMSPEQARGQEADQRADVWAFGVILWEMLCGRQLFRGPTVSDTLAEVLKTDPDLDALPEATPPVVHRLLRRCLSRDPKRRLRDMGDAWLELSEAESEPEDQVGVTAAEASARSRWMRTLLALILGLGLGAILYSWLGPAEQLEPAPGGSPTITTLTRIGEVGPVSTLAISRDGSSVVVARGWLANSPLLLRRLDSAETAPLPGTEGAAYPFFSPDGRWIAFFDGDELRKIPVEGGASTAVCEAGTPTGGSWSDDGWIYFAHGENRLARVAAEGGDPQELSKEMIFTPHALPGGRGALVTLTPQQVGSIRRDNATIAWIGADGELRPLLEGGFAPKYASSGHLTFMRQGDLWVVPFDLDRLEVTGSAFRAVPGVWHDSTWPAETRYDISDQGRLVYIAGGDFAETVPTWFGLDGSEEPLPVPRTTHGTFQLSPDRTRLALQVAGAKDQIHIYDFARSTLTRLTFEGPSWHPTWSHDGTEVIYAGLRDGVVNILRKQVDGSGEEVRLLTESQLRQIDAIFVDPYSVSPDGQHLLATSWGSLDTGGDLWIISLSGETDPRPLLATPDNEIIPMFSPDGDYVLYLSDKAGPYGIYVRPFPDVERREWAISTQGGYDARWSPTGDAIVYRVGARQLMSVPIQRQPELAPGTEQPWLEIDAHDSAGFSFDLSLDGQRVLVNRPAMSLTEDRPVTLITDWLAVVDRANP